MSKQKYKSGDIVGQWTVLKYAGAHKKHLNTRYLCKCSCGTIKTVLTTNLSNASSLRCKQCAVKKITTRTHIMAQLFNVMYHGAKRRSLQIDITEDDMLCQFLKQNKKCALTGVELYISPIRGKYSETTASLDRVDNTKGYLKDNIQWLHKDVNALKNDFDQNKFVEWCEKITKYRAETII